MTEQKRFYLNKGFGDTFSILDMTPFGEQIYRNKSSADMKLLVNLLNNLHEENQFAKLLANHRGEMVSMANAIIQNECDDKTREIWETFKEEMYQKWKKERGIE